MSRLPFISELHDIGKMMDVECLRLTGKMSKRQKVHDIDLKALGVPPPTNPSWWAVWSEELGAEQSFDSLNCAASVEEKALILLTKIADGTAASVSRIELRDSKAEALRHPVQPLWRPSLSRGAVEKETDWAAFRKSDDLRDMIAFFDQCQSPSDFFERFHDSLSLTPEDKSAPGNFIPLRVHLDLMGKIFRVINQYASLDQSNPAKPQILYDGQPVSTLRAAVGGLLGTKDEHVAGKWVFRIVKCYVRFSPTIVRLQDLNIFELRRRRIEEVVKNQNALGNVETQPYAVLFHTDDFLCLFLPKENHLSLRSILRPLWEKDLWIEYEELEAEFNLLTSAGERTYKSLQQKYQTTGARRFIKLRYNVVGPDLNPAINPPLCDLCQQRPGQEYIKDQVREWLCGCCREIRQMGEPAGVYAKWEEERFAAAWLKVSLDQELLLSCLQRLFEAYVENGPGMNQVSTEDKQRLKQGFRPLAAQMEFVREYDEFLHELGESLRSLRGPSGEPFLSEGLSLLFPINRYRELAIIQLRDSAILGTVLDAFAERLRFRFPECLEDCPIRLSLSVGNPKHPINEHWDFFSRPQEAGMALCLQQPGIREIAMTIAQYTALREKIVGEHLAHFLHRLTGLEQKAGELNALAEALKRRQRFPQIHELMIFHRLGLRKILDFHRLIGPSARQAEKLHA